MHVHLIGYDLHRVRDYSRLYQCLLGWNAQRLLESMWVVILPVSDIDVRQVLSWYIDGDDSLVILDLPPGTSWSTVRAMPGGTGLLEAISYDRAA